MGSYHVPHCCVMFKRICGGGSTTASAESTNRDAAGAMLTFSLRLELERVFKRAQSALKVGRTLFRYNNFVSGKCSFRQRQSKMYARTHTRAHRTSNQCPRPQENVLL